MKILITGSTGLVGSEAVKFFTEKGWEVVGIDNNMRAKFFGTPDKVPTLKIDIREEPKINDLFQTHKFDAIIHTAGQPSHDYSKDHVLEDFHINAWGTLVLLEATRKYCPEAVFVFISSDKVYGENMSRLLTEKGPRYHAYEAFDEELGLDFAGKRSPFGCSKASADMYVQEYGNYFGIKTGCFRLGCITGKNHEGAELHGFLAYLAGCIKNQVPYTIFGNGKQVRDQIHAYDLVNALWYFIQNPKVGAVYNLGGGEERSVSVLEAIELIQKETGKKSLIIHGKERSGDRKWDIHNVSKFKKDYPEWDYKYSLQDIIKDLCVY